MAKNPLFSTYRQGENRVTSTMLAVFERIDLSLLQRLLAGASGEASLQMVSFVNQPSGKGESVPDARISGRFAFWFEVKTKRDEIKVRQLREHLESLDGPRAEERLFVITPDPTQPRAVADLKDDRVVWFNFRALSDAIDADLADPTGMVSEQARLLLRELQALLQQDGLLDNDNVVIVAARMAFPEYRTHAAYVCQPNRSFRLGLTHMGFYTQGAIQPVFARILCHETAVLFTHVEAARRQRLKGRQQKKVAEVIARMLRDESRQPGSAYDVFILSPEDAPETLRLTARLVNDKVAESGEPFAWTLSQRYTSLAALKRPGISRTSELDAAPARRPAPSTG